VFSVLQDSSQILFSSGVLKFADTATTKNDGTDFIGSLQILPVSKTYSSEHC
jgi:hypothetical protein